MISNLKIYLDKIKLNNTATTVAITITSLTLIRNAIKKLLQFKKRQQYQKDVQEFIAKRDQKIQSFLLKYGKEVPQDLQNEIIDCTVEQLAKAIADKKYTCRQVIIAYCIRAGTIGKKFNLIANVNFDEAIEIATLKDQQRDSLTKLPPLFGIPFSVKEHLKLKGVPVTAGFSRMVAANPAENEAIAVQSLRNQGAIPIITSNIPQGLFGVITANNIYGMAKNPWNPLRNVGGSSGGEAGLIASRSVPAGIGSDSGGSLRIPALFCGVYTFKPTGRRVSKFGRVGITLSEVESFREAEIGIGPVGRSVEDLILFSKPLLEKCEEDPYHPFIPFNQEKVDLGAQKKLNVAYIDESPYTEVASSIKNVIHETIAVLKEKGHNVFPFNYPEIDRLNEIMIGLYTALGKLPFKNGLQCESPLSINKWRFFIQELPRPLLKLLCKFYSLKGEGRLANWGWIFRPKSLIEFFGFVRQKEMLRLKFNNEWKKNKIDILISPVFPLPALKYEEGELMLPYLTFCSLANTFDMPSGHIPIRRIRLDEQVFKSKYNDCISRAYKNTIEGSQGLPIGIQVTAMSFEDELCLGFMKQIEEMFKFHDFPEID